MSVIPENYDTDQRVSVCFSREEFEEAGKDPYITILRIDGNHGMTWLVTWQKSGGKKLWLPVSSYTFLKIFI